MGTQTSTSAKADRSRRTDSEEGELARARWGWGRTTFAVVGGLATVAYGSALGFPLLATGKAPEAPRQDCVTLTKPAEPPPDILGPSTLDDSDLIAWWRATDHAQPPKLTIDIEDLIALYDREASTEGVRGDLAFAQAVHETGYFDNNDTSINNFAGIGHYDDADEGVPFPDAATGVRAHIQLLKRFALGNDAPLMLDAVAPDAGASATTWDQLAGTWATDLNYWSALSELHEAMVDHANGDSVDPPRPDLCDLIPFPAGD